MVVPIPTLPFVSIVILVVREFKDVPELPGVAVWNWIDPPAAFPVPIPPARIKDAPAIFVPLPPVPLTVMFWGLAATIPVPKYIWFI